MKAIEVEGTIDEQHQLHVDEPLPVSGPSRVRVLILIPEDTEIGEEEWLRAAAASPSFAFLNDSAEEIYTLEDGEPFRDEG